MSNIHENGSEHSHEPAEIAVEEKVKEHWNKEKDDMSDLLKNIPNMGEFQKWLQDRLRYIASCSVHPEHALEYWSKVRIPGLELPDMMPTPLEKPEFYSMELKIGSAFVKFADRYTKGGSNPHIKMLCQQITLKENELSKTHNMLLGRQGLYMMVNHYRVSDTDSELYVVKELLKIDSRPCRNDETVDEYLHRLSYYWDPFQGKLVNPTLREQLQEHMKLQMDKFPCFNQDLIKYKTECFKIDQDKILNGGKKRH